MTRETALNNPMGLKKVPPIKWQGLADEQDDPTLLRFLSAEYGIRAWIRNLLTYGNRGIATPAEIISRWAPSSADGNPTAQYIANVCSWCGWQQDEHLDLDQADVMRPLVKAIIRQENGVQPYSDAVIDDAMRMAGIADMPVKPLLGDGNGGGLKIASIGTGVAAASETVRQLSDVRDTVDTSVDLLQWAVHLGPWVALALVAIGLAGIVYSEYQKRQRVGL